MGFLQRPHSGFGRVTRTLIVLLIVSLAGSPADAGLNGLSGQTPATAGDNVPSSAAASQSAPKSTPSAFADARVATGIVSGVGTDGWTAVALEDAYDAKVVVTSPVYGPAAIPLVVRVRETGPSGFELRVDRLDGNTGSVPPIDVHFFVVEAGVYTSAEHGVDMEAVRYESTVFSRAGLWAGESRSYLGDYQSPVVVGQVMSYNDTRPTVFFSHGQWTFTPVGADHLVVGRHIGEDPDWDRLPETIGYVAIETGSFQLGDWYLEAAVGADTVAGIEAGPYAYPLQGLGPIDSVVASRTGVDGRDGGWAVLAAPDPLSSSSLALAIDEDQLVDSERVHTTEQVAYLAAGRLPESSIGCGSGLPEQGVRGDIVVVVNRNSTSSCAVAEHYAEARGLGRNNLVEVSVPADYFIDWNTFRSLRDQIVAFLGANTLGAGAAPVDACTDGDSVWYCQAAIDRIRAETRIRYIVTTRGVPTRTTVDNSNVGYTSTTSVDNYLRHWLVHYFAEDEPFRFTQRETDFGDGRGMRHVDPASDHELIVGRLDGLTTAATLALIDRTIDAENAGIYGVLFGSQYKSTGTDGNFNRYDGDEPVPIYGDETTGWRLNLGLWGERRTECLEYLDYTYASPLAETPEHCTVQLTDGQDPGPSDPAGRQPRVVDALVYLGSKDNSSAATGNWADLLEWLREPGCTVRMCEDSPDPDACRAASIDPYGELNTLCVGVADGFVGFNMQSYVASYMTAWPTGWRGPSNGSYDGLAFPEVIEDPLGGTGPGMWFRNSDEVPEPRCFASDDYAVEPDVECRSRRRIWIRQILDVPAESVDTVSPQQFRVRLRLAAQGLEAPVALVANLHIAGGGETVVYGPVTLASATAGESAWQTAETTFTLNPAYHATEVQSFDKITLVLSSDYFSGAVGIDDVTIEHVAQGVDLAVNGHFSGGYRSLSDGSYAATFLSRMNGVAWWGSVSHHASGGYSFADHPLTTLVYFLRGLPLGEAVWFAEHYNSGILYGDPLYSPVAVRLDAFNDWDYLVGSVELHGSAVNGRDPSRVSTTFTLDYCPGTDFFLCDQAGSWMSTGTGGAGGEGLLGHWDTTGIEPGAYTLRLGVTSVSLDTGKEQSFFDYQVVTIADAAGDDDGDGLSNLDEIDVHGLDPTNPDMDADGLVDGDELAHGLDPLDADTDDDGMADGFEVTYGLNPLLDDSGLDPDADGLSNLLEFGYGSNPVSDDGDGDGLMDALEILWLGTNPMLVDTDGDDLADGFELKVSRTDPTVADTDDDAMPDGWEWTRGLDPKLVDALEDPDVDEVANVVEYLHDTDPFDGGSVPPLDTWHVDAAAPGGGDGSAILPFGTLSEALQAASNGDTIQLAPGRYATGEALDISSDVAIVAETAGVILEPSSLVVRDLVWGGFHDVVIETWGPVDIRAVRNWVFQGGTMGSGHGITVDAGARGILRNAGVMTWGSIKGITLDGESVLDLVNVTIAGFSTGIEMLDTGSLVSLHNGILANGADYVGDPVQANVSYSMLSDGQFAGVDGNFTGVPLFMNEWWGDFRQATGSPGIDAGDPNDDYAAEPVLNGCRINLGQFGNTALAAESASGC